MSHIKSEKLLDVAVEASLAASDLIMEALQKPKTSNHKGTTDLVTATDLESEKIIKAIIKASFSDHSVLAEETGKETSESNYLWVIDPLDGTTNFVHGYPSFGVSIGVYFNREPIASAIIEMPTLKLYTAIKGKGAFCEGKEIYASKTSSIQDSLMVTGFGYEHGENWEKNMGLFRHFTDITQGVRRLGAAAIDMCHVACGKADAYWEYDIKPWDIGAGIGSVAVEIARFCSNSIVYAVEKTALGTSLIEENCRRFQLKNVVSIHGNAPEILHHLRSPHRIFIGGSSGKLRNILGVCGIRMLPEGVIVLAFTTLENFHTAVSWVEERRRSDRSWSYRLLQVQLSRSIPVANLTRFNPLNPVTIMIIRHLDKRESRD